MLCMSRNILLSVVLMGFSSVIVLINEVLIAQVRMGAMNGSNSVIMVKKILMSQVGWLRQEEHPFLKSIHCFGSVVPAGGYLLLAPGTFSSSFQNGGNATDGVRVVDAAGAVIDTVWYDDPNTNGLLDDLGNTRTFCADPSEGILLCDRLFRYQ